MFSQALLLLLSFTPFSSQTPLTKRAFSNGPVITANFPDPAFIKVDGQYIAFATNNGAQNVQIATSPDFNTWTVTGNDALPTLPSWTTGVVWAPDVVQVADGSFVLYFCAVSSTNPSMHCVGTATSSSVQGPYTANDTPFACPLDQGGAIDASGFQDADGSLYVTYKVDGNSLGGGGPCGNGDYSHPTPLMLQSVQSDGVTPTPNSPPIELLDRDDADGPLIEAPDIVLVNGTYYLFFSSNCFNGPYYDTSYATAGAVSGPYTKAKEPLLISGGDGGKLFSPGGATVGIGPDSMMMVFHADETEGDASVRQMWTAGVAIGGGLVSIS